jgi:hypothetical protein
MAKSNDKIDPAAAEDNLLHALESIKSLLEQSETKLTAARESISRANQPRKDTMPAKEKNNEPVVPILDDIVEPENYELPLEQEEQAKEEEVAETLLPDVGDAMDQAMLDYLDALQASLEKNVRNTLMRTVVNIEKEVKKTINEQLDVIRQQIRNKKD